ncbi:hypothetical protein H2200_000730 [Cladophialophora chaetospira]|uniref:Telomeric single stranded DNA binding POT1/Cdc13 domain-containing protein n=1 Tax=Cladophialophora chaetospira TaxID=386627 RepID=A0AA38XQ24_9EURO|nr:hypothetical protein H2200_000730 [Cladophialophora chaetospira]
MTTVAQQAESIPTFETSSQIPIADISPSSDDGSFYILAQVALVWPYSSSTGTLALLLADPDIRRRKSRGQVKVVFRYGCAREVAKTKVGIGDTIKLALAGCIWTETGDAVSTPGKKIDWDLEYRRCVILQVLQDGHKTAAVDYTANDPEPSAVNGAISLLNGTYIGRPSVNGVLHRQPSTIQVPYLTPRKPRRSGSAATFVDTAFDPSIEEDGYVPGQGRKRTKFARNSGAWSLVDEDEEPQLQSTNGPLQLGEEVDLTMDSDEHGDGKQVEHERVEHAPTETQPSFENMRPPDQEFIEVSSSPPPGPAIEPPLMPQSPVMGPPSTPFRPVNLRLPPGEVEAPQASPGSDATTTPRLHPIASPGLPLVSPLIQRAGVEIGYFPAFDVRSSQLDASGDNTERAATNDNRSPHEVEVESIQSDESLLIVEQLSTVRNPAEDAKPGAAQYPEDSAILENTVTGPEHWNSFSTNGELQSQFLSPMEPKVDHELEADDLAFRRSPPLPDVAESEDDDMYGAPAGFSRTNGSVVNPPPVETPKSPLDVLEQFLQMSPVTVAGPTTSFEQRADSKLPTTPPVTAQGQSVPERVSTNVRPDKTPFSTIQHSPVTYPESQSPFRQNRDRQTSSNASSRPSSARLYSFDGTTDEQQPFAEYINHLAQIAATAEGVQLQTSDNLRQEDEIQEDLSTAAQATAAVTQAEEVVRPDSNRSATEEERLQTGRSTESDAAVIAKPLAPTESSSAVDQDAAAANEVDPAQAAETPPQLPTPDHSQMPVFSPEPQAQASLKHNEEAVAITLPSPQDTQELIEAREIQEQGTVEVEDEAGLAISENEVAAQINSESDLSQQTLEGAAGGDNELSQATAQDKLQVQEVAGGGDLPQTLGQVTKKAPPQIEPEEEAPEEAAAASATPSMAPKLAETQPDTTTPLRVSQRLSARKSIMTSNISSPYFTPRKSALQPPSSPIRKENVRPSSPDRSTPPPLRIQKGGKAPLTADAVEEVEQNGNEIAPISPNKARRPITRRHAGTTTPLAYYAHLSSLDEHYGNVVDILAVCAESSTKPERAKSGPKDYDTTLRLADPSLASDEHGAIPVQIFRHAKSALPTATGGDVVILRNFKVQTIKRRFMLLSTESSSWAVFKAKPGSTLSWSDVVISGPPIEYGPAETSRVKLLFSWWNSNGKQQFSSSTSASNHEDVETSSPELRSKSPQRKENVQPVSKPIPAARRRLANETDNFNNEDAVENFFASFNNRDDESVADVDAAGEAANTLPAKPALRREVNMTDNVTNEAETTKLSPRTLRRRKANRTDHFDNEGDDETNVADYDRGKSAPLMDATNRRRQSVVSLAASEAGTTVTPRRSARQKQRKSPSLVHELRDGTRYADDDQGKGGAVVHELRDGATYVDE